MGNHPSAIAAPDPRASLQEQVTWLQQQRLAFGQQLSELRFDSNALADEIGLTVNLHRFELVASTSDYSESTLEIPYFGATRYRIEGKDWFDRAGHQALYLPGQASQVETGHFNGLLFNLNPARLAQTIGAMSHRRVPLELAERWVQQPIPINLADPRVLQHQRALEIGLTTLAEHNGTGMGDPQAPLALGVETLTYQCSAWMLLIAMGQGDLEEAKA